MSAFLTRTKRLEKEGASVAASVGVAGRASSLLEPCNESLDGEGLGELSAGGRSRGRAGSRCGLSSDGGSSGSRGRGRRGSSNRGSSSGGSSRGGGGSGSSAVTSAGGRSRGRRAGAAGPESRAGDVVVDGGSVGVEDDAILVGGVEAGTDNTLGGLRSGTSDLWIVSMWLKGEALLILPQCSSTGGSSGHRWRSQHRGER